ncbi:hypothetical protein VTO73DRAFT_13873 [Trametes versicolor]
MLPAGYRSFERALSFVLPSICYDAIETNFWARCVVCGLKSATIWIVESWADFMLKHVFVNCTDSLDLRPFHGKATAFDHAHLHAPFPALFPFLETRVRESHLGCPAAMDVPEDSRWQG